MFCESLRGSLENVKEQTASSRTKNTAEKVKEKVVENFIAVKL